MTQKNAAFFGPEETIARVYAQGRREQVAERTHLYPDIVGASHLSDHLTRLEALEVIFSTWGMPLLSPDMLDHLPSLRAVFYAAGSVQGFARPLLERGITVVSAWQANAVPVVEFTLAQILLSGKGYWRSAHACRARESWPTTPAGPGNFDTTVALLGAGAIGRQLLQRLQTFALTVIVYDPFLTDAEAQTLGIARVSLEEAFARGHVVSNHLADKPEIRKLLNESLFALLSDGAVFINTGRGATVDEEGLVRVLSARPDLTALLDVTHPEPPAEGSPLYALPNVHLTPHIAGAIGGEVVRMADLCLREFTAWETGEPLTAAVTWEMLNHLA